MVSFCSYKIWFLFLSAGSAPLWASLFWCSLGRSLTFFWDLVIRTAPSNLKYIVHICQNNLSFQINADCLLAFINLVAHYMDENRNSLETICGGAEAVSSCRFHEVRCVDWTNISPSNRNSSWTIFLVSDILSIYMMQNYAWPLKQV